jgi:hypothetical protein
VAFESSMRIVDPKATTCRSQRIVDCAFMLMHRGDVGRRGPRVYFGMADSSQQGHADVDWLNSQFYYILRSDLSDCFECCQLRGVSRVRFAEAYSRNGFGALSPEAQPAITAEEMGIVSFRVEAQRQLRQNIAEHTLPPVGMGRKASSTEHKIRAWLHAMLLDHGTDQGMVRALASFMSMTTDLGVESQIADYECKSWQDFLPSWQRAGFLQPDCEAADEGAAETPRALLPNGMVCPGLLHIIDNAFLDLDKSLPGWSPWYRGLVAIVKLLSTEGLRKRFVYFCVKDSATPEFADRFRSDLPSLAHWRWGVLMTILTLLLPLEFPFRTTWSAKKFRGRAAEEVNAREPRPGSEELGAPTELQLDVVSEVARDAAWWRYAAMLVTLHCVGLALQCWGEACPCCDPDPQVRDRTRRAELELATGLSEEAAAPGPVAERCPLRGKRAPEMAAGQLFAVLQQICDAKLQDVLVSCSQAYLTPDQTASILQDFEFGKAQLRRAL